MSQALSVAANLSTEVRKVIGVQVVSGSQPIGYLTKEHQVSRKFVYQQGDKAQQALDETFALSPSVTLNRPFLNQAQENS